jgi:hypothetical protein
MTARDRRRSQTKIDVTAWCLATVVAVLALADLALWASLQNGHNPVWRMLGWEQQMSIRQVR